MALIMVMEDDPVQSDLLSDELALMGHEVIATFNASEALERMETTRVDLLITDIFVRDKDNFVPNGGVLLIGRVRAAGRQNPRDWRAKLPILAISGVTMERSRVPALSIAQNVGATRSLTKPFSFEALSKVIGELLGGEPSEA